MLSEEERKVRRNTLGASEVHKITNFDNKSAQDLWEEKVGLKEQNEICNQHLTAGNILEEEALDFYGKNNNVKMILNERVEHPTIKNFIVSLDGRDTTNNMVIENKVIGENTWNKWQAKRKHNSTFGETKINLPSNYYLQVQAQMCATNTNKAILLANVLTAEEKENPITTIITDIHQREIVVLRDEETIKEIQKRAEFFLKCVHTKRRPREKNFIEEYVF